MRNFQDTFETCKRSFISAFLICMTAPLNEIFKDNVRQKIFWIGRTEFFTLAEELKSFIALNILSFNIIEI